MNPTETREIIEAISGLRDRGGAMAVATIVSVRGSTYRRPGARLLIPEQGELVGNLSGGCLEGEVETVARDVMTSGEPRLVLYDLTADDEVVWGWGLGCNGAIEVFVEPGDLAAEVADAIRAAIAEERPIVAVTALASNLPPVRPGSRVLVHGDGRTENSLGDVAADSVALDAALEALGSPHTSPGGHCRDVAVGDGGLRLFVEVVEPPLRLLVCGAGHDAIPLVRLVSTLGWQAFVIDDRESLLYPKRFPEAAGFVRSEPAGAASAAAPDERAYAVVMSHNYLRDRDYLKSFLGTDVGYIGMLGPKARLKRLLDDLRQQGIVPTAEDRTKIHGPAGLDVGGEGPEEVALAIVAEVLAVSRARAAGYLRDRRAPIHERDLHRTWALPGSSEARTRV